MTSRIAAPGFCIQHRRFTKQDGWRLQDLSLSLNGNIAVTSYNETTHQTYIDVYTLKVSNFDSRDKPKIIYSKEFEKYEDENWIYLDRIVSFIDNDALVSCLGNRLEVFQVNKDEVLRSCRVNGIAKCLSVRERREIFICFEKSNKITVYDVINLNEIRSIILKGIQDGYWPYDMTAIADKIFVCLGEDKEGSNHISLIFEEKNGRILSELTKPTDSVTWYVNSVGVNMNTLGIAGVVWYDSYYKREGGRWQIVFYPLLSEKNCSFLIVEVESGVYRIRISDRGDRMITGNCWTGEMKVYDMADVFTYSHFKEKLASTLTTDECTKLAHFFKMPRDQTDAILSSELPSDNLLLALEVKNILHPHDVDRLIEAFEELKTSPFCRHVAEIFQKTRSPSDYKQIIKKLNEEMKTLRMKSEEEGKELKSQNKGEKDLNLSAKASEFLQESSFEDEFGKFSVRVSEKLTKANCVKLATYFNFPVDKTDLIKNDFDTPGMTLFDLLKERHIVNIHNVMSLKEALEQLELKDISDTLVTPYQKKIDRLRFEQRYLSQ